MNCYAGIPIANIWLLMLYASDLNLSHTRQAVAILDNPTSTSPLVAWFVDLLEHYLQAPQHAYLPQHQALSHIRGKVDLGQSYLRQSMQQGKVYCHYADLGFNYQQHQYLSWALHSMLKDRHEKALTMRLLRCQRQLHQLGVTLPVRAPDAVLQLSILGVEQPQLQQILVLAKLLLERKMPSTTAGQQRLQQPKKDDVHWLRRLFEKAMAGFYKKYLPKTWQIWYGAVLKWPSDAQHEALPQMKSDLILQHQDGRCILMDTKFTQILQRGYYKNAELFKSQHIYQLYTYLRSQEYVGSRFQFTQGILLYPSVGAVIQADVQIQHYPIGFYSVDLSQSARQIEQQLLGFINAVTHTDCDHTSSPDIKLDRLA